MELVPIIYSSLLVVISLLSFVLIISFFWSKILKFGNSTIKNEIKTQNNNDKIAFRNNQTEEKIIRKEATKNTFVKPIANRVLVDSELIYNNKIKIVNKTEIRPKKISKNETSNQLSRYMIVNTFPHENLAKSNLYSKFSKISVEYSKS